MKTALVVAARFPGRSATQAGHRICASHIEQICKVYSTDLVVVCRESDDTSDLSYFQSICRRVLVRKISKLEAVFNALRNLNLPYSVRVRVSRSINYSITQFAQEHYDLVHFEWTEAAIYQGITFAAKRQLMCHDVLAELNKRRASGGIFRRVLWSGEFVRALNFENSILKNMNRVFALSDADADDIRSFGVNRANIVVVVPEFYKTPPLKRSIGSTPIRLLFWGSFSRSENRAAARILVERILPMLPQNRFRVVLAGMDAEKHFRPASDVTVLGFVRDAGQAFSSGDIGVFPLYQGSGLKIKVLEAMHAGLPVITTLVGREGFTCTDADGLIAAETIDDFVFEILRLESHPELYQKLSQAAARWTHMYASAGISDVAEC